MTTVQDQHPNKICYYHFELELFYAQYITLIIITVTKHFVYFITA